MPAMSRRSASGSHAGGTAARSPRAPAAAKYRFANVTSSWVMNTGSAKKPALIWLFICWITARYMRLKQATPSVAGSAASIASIRAMASATEATGASGTGAATDMEVTIRRPSEFRGAGSSQHAKCAELNAFHHDHEEKASYMHTFLT